MKPAIAVLLACLAAAGCAASPRERPLPPEEMSPAEAARAMTAAEEELARQLGALGADVRPLDCARAAVLRDNVCSLAERICALAPRVPADARGPQRCADARGRCQAARQRVDAACRR
jgi:hypothetical protein